MHLKILGTRGEIDHSLPRHANQSGLLIDQQLLVDLGEKKYLKQNPRWILVTHLHPDHAYFMRRGHREGPATDAPIFAPEKAEHVRLLTQKKQLGPYRITPIPTQHSKHVKSQAYLIEKGRKSLLYTGDLVWIDKKYHHLFDSVDLVITDGSFLREGGMVRKDQKILFGHNGIPNLIRLFQPHTEQILFVHFGSWFYKDIKASRKKMRGLAKKYAIDLLVGYDGMEILI